MLQEVHEIKLDKIQTVNVIQLTIQNFWIFTKQFFRIVIKGLKVK